MKAIQTQGLVSKNLLPYMGVQFHRQVAFDLPGGKRTFRVLTYQAYNSMGLIGPEMNGIAICDDDKRQVVCDGLCKQSTGYFGASQEQFDRAEAICALEWPAFRDLVNGSPNLRMRLE